MNWSRVLPWVLVVPCFIAGLTNFGRDDVGWYHVIAFVIVATTVAVILFHAKKRTDGS